MSDTESPDFDRIANDRAILNEARQDREELDRLRRVNEGLVEAAQIVLAGLNARIDVAPSSAKPVFNGIVELHAALHSATEPPLKRESCA